MEISAQRRTSVENARQTWIKRLIDLSRRNNLLYYRSLKWGTLNLSLGDRERWPTLLRGDSVLLKHLAGGLPDEDLLSKALAIWRRAQANLEEKGLATMFVALGMASWKANDGGRDSDAPVLLLPVVLEIKGHSGTSLAIHRGGSAQVNLVLLHILEKEFGVPISAEKLLSLLQGDEEDEAFDPSPVYRQLESACASMPEFKIRDVAILGNFAFQKMAMVRDLQENAEQLLSSDVIAALAGDPQAKQGVGAKTGNPDPRQFDAIPPQSEFLILDADSSQQSAIAAVLKGQNAVIHGPPGTGKSQTIANLIASLVAAGKRVLFVAEKRAALQVVLKRLEQVGLDKIAIDLHGADISPKRVTEQLAAALSTVRQSVPVDCDRMHQQFVERRARLNLHVENLHRRRTPGGLSVYELQGVLLRQSSDFDSDVRWRGTELAKIETAEPTKIRDLLREAGGLAPLFLRCDPSPWNGVRLADGASAQQAIDLVRRVSSQDWSDFEAALSEMIAPLGFRAPNTLREAQEISSLLAAVHQTLRLYSPAIFGSKLQETIQALSKCKNGGFAAVWSWCTSSEYRNARKQTLGLRIAGKARTPELFAELNAAEEERISWAKLSGGSSSPQMVPAYANFQQKLEQMAADLAALGSIISNRQFNSLTLAETKSLIDSLARDRLTPLKLPKLCEVEQGLEKCGAGKLVEELRKKKLDPGTWPAAFDQCWYASCLEAAQAEDPQLAGFNGRTHDGFVREFKELDKERIRIAAARVRRSYAERAIAAMNDHKDQEYLIRSESEKKRRHRPLRALFSEAQHVLTALCPCWMASPLSVSQLLGATCCFDFVIFDEASQVLPEDAIPAVMRGAQLVVAGDSWQLPPTTFFAAADDDDSPDDQSSAAVEGFESLLDTTNTFLPSWYLDWHYRSRDESLISFSNHFIYKNRMVTFPGPGGSPVLQHVLLQQEAGVDGQEESSSAEVKKVVELILEHAEKKPGESLGVIAMGLRHADRVQQSLDQALQKRPDLAHFFDASAEERFFVKNLERVQGDERDAIILTIGYGKDRGGNLPFRFGPLLSIGGQRRLNVAVTRARQHMTVLSSFSHLDMDPAKVKRGTGVELLRFYLEYAASGGKRLEGLRSTDFPMNSFEAEVFDVLSSKGIPLVPQCGASSYRIDFVALHPTRPGQYVLAMECDGASYHSSPTARDRDRLRQQQLENLGWKFHRIWSTDWFMRKDEEVNRAISAYQGAVSSIENSRRTGEIPQAAAPLLIPVVSPTTPLNRGRRPQIGHHDSITAYPEWELVQMIEWIQSDGRLRTNEEIIDELLPELGFHRRGSRIEEVLGALLEKHRIPPGDADKTSGIIKR